MTLELMKNRKYIFKHTEIHTFGFETAQSLKTSDNDLKGDGAR